MICPNCEFEFTAGTVCPSCKVDSVLFRRTAAASDVLYNDALSKAKESDLSGAIASLEKSVAFNKNNINARNLLGLIYFEIGYVGDALKEWVISASLDKGNSLAKYYLNNIQEDSRTMERLNDAVKMYNYVLENMSDRSDDVSIIQLKKAIDTNPKFIDAHNLLAYCYIMQKDFVKANQLLDKVLKMDLYNKTASRYYNAINDTQPRSDATQRKKIVEVKTAEMKPVAVGGRYVEKTKKGGGFYFAEILTFFVGVACTLAVVYTLALPAIISEKDGTINALKTSYTTAEQTYKDTIAADTKKISELTELNKRLTDENVSMNAELVMIDKLQKVTQVESLYAAKNYQDAATILYTLDETGLPSDITDKLKTLRANAYSQAATQLYNQGVKFFNAKDYEAAKTDLNKGLTFATDATASNIIYYLGQTAEKLDDIPGAKRYYETIVNDYPTSAQLAKAKARLNVLK